MIEKAAQTESPFLTPCQEKLEVIDSIQDHIGDQLSLLSLPGKEKNWQPTDFLPDLSKDGWEKEVEELRESARGLPDETLVVLVGDMITEEALPNYSAAFNRFAGANDKTGVDDSPYAQWGRAWVAEENRHGDVLNKFLYLTGRVDMRAIERTIQHLIVNGFNLQHDGDPYKGFVYTSFQERATKISHSNVAKLCQKAGFKSLHRMCQIISGDEARHEEGYKRFMDKIFEVDPNNAVLSFAEMMRRTITMPAKTMLDDKDPNLFEHFEMVAQRAGVYTALDYADIIDHLIKRWKLETLTGLNSEAAEGQDYLCKLSNRYRRLAERIEKKIKDYKPVPFSWIFDRAV
ncbi:MAG: acyl-ACP desaturase [Candidatus Omnitrophica bacterium]|nr:acyl-ACP desaturase [Candidatus Omnitrophota bacterium]